jgi:TRAP-type C4-dicarboxylate transport system permease small subunit
MTINKNIRNIAIVLALAVIVDFVRGGQAAASTVLQALSLAFLALMAWIGSRLYREHRTELDSLGTKNRAILYIAIGVAAVTLTASPRLEATAGGSVALIVLLAGCVYAVFQVARAYRQY